MICLGGSAAAADFPRAEIFGGYQYTHLEGSNGLNGFNFAVNGNYNNWFGVAADLSAGYSSQFGNSYSNYTYTFGPVFAYRANQALTPFAHALIGGDHASASLEFAGQSASESANGFAMMLGGGVDVRATDRIAVRAVQADWLLVRGSGGTSSRNVRISLGVVFRF